MLKNIGTLRCKTVLNLQNRGVGADTCTVTLLSLCHKYGAVMDHSGTIAVMDHSGSTGMESLATGRHQNSATATSQVFICNLPLMET